MLEIQCRHYEKGCNCELCPMDSTLDKHHWFSDESICPKREFARLPWIRKQRRLAALKADDGYFFTHRMLETMSRATKSTRGANPEDGDAGEARWIAARTGGNRK